MSISELSKYQEICTFSIIFAKPGFMADTLFIVALPSFRSLWLLTMSMLSFSPNFWLRWWASQDLVRALTPRLLMNVLDVSCMPCAMHGMWSLTAGHWITEPTIVECSSSAMKYFEDRLSVVIPSKRLSVRSNKLGTFLKCMTMLAPVCWPFTYHRRLGFGTGKN